MLLVGDFRCGVRLLSHFSAETKVEACSNHRDFAPFADLAPALRDRRGGNLPPVETRALASDSEPGSAVLY